MLDAAYNNRAAVPAYSAIVEERRARSERLRRTLSFEADVRYGPGARERLDFFPAAAADAPVFAFIHGGYWQSNDKEPSTFLVEGPLARGFSVALIEYTLAPEATLDAIVMEIRRAIDLLMSNRNGAPKRRIYVGGHSAGGHLAATMLGHPGVAGVLAISGLFDLEPIRLCYLNEKLRLSADAVRHNSPIMHIPKKGPAITVAVGAAELPELVRQSSDYAEALQSAGLSARYLPIARHDHFTVLDELAQANGALCDALCDMQAQ